MATVTRISLWTPLTFQFESQLIYIDTHHTEMLIILRCLLHLSKLRVFACLLFAPEKRMTNKRKKREEIKVTIFRLKLQQKYLLTSPVDPKSNHTCC